MRYQRRVVLAGGSYDLLHVGHVSYLEWCKRKGDILVVCVAGDKRVRARKGASRPIIDQNHRAAVLSSLKMVDFVFISDLPPFSPKIMDAIRPDIIGTTANEPSPERKQALVDYVKTKYPETKVLLLTRRRAGEESTTLIIGRIRKREATS